MVKSGDGILVPGTARYSSSEEVGLLVLRQCYPVSCSFVLAKVHREFNELMFLRKEGRMLEQLTVRDYDLGTSLPVFSNAGILP